MTSKTKLVHFGLASPHLVLLLHGPAHALAAGGAAGGLSAALVADERTAGRLAQASREFKQQLPQQRLLQIREARRLAEKAQMEAQRQRKHAAVLELFEAIGGGPLYRCKAHVVAFGTPCGRQLRVPHSGSLQVFMQHLQCYHAAEYASLMLALELM